MLFSSINRLVALLRCTFRRSKHMSNVAEEEFNKHYVEKFLRWDIDGWELRQEMNNILGMDLIPDPMVIEAGLRACRQVNDIALAIRWLEGCRNKCGDEVNEIYPYLMHCIQPTLTELGIPTLEELHFTKPQLALESVYDM